MTERALPATQLDLFAITPPEAEVDRVFAPADLRHGAEDVRPVGAIRFTGRVQKQGEDRFRLAGRLTAALEVECSRCLEPFILPVDAAVDLSYVPQPTPAAASSAEEVELSDDDLTTAFYREHLIDLAEMAREQFYLALPMRLLCRDSCRGLCAQCGTNLNAETCQCKTQWEDPRLAVLRTLIRKQEH